MNSSDWSKWTARIKLNGENYFLTKQGWVHQFREPVPKLEGTLNAALFDRERARLWVGNTGAQEVFVFDSQIKQTSEATVWLWIFDRDRFVEIDRQQARTSLQKADQKTFERAMLSYLASIVVRHRFSMDQRGLHYGGVRQSDRNRQTVCFNCGRALTTEQYPECVVCGWIICECAACHC